MYGEGRRYPRVCVSATIMDASGRVLVTRRSKKVWYPETWCLPGGHVEGGESWIGALRNEVKEEVGLTIKNEILLGIYSDPVLNILPDPVTGEKRCFVSAVFLVKDFEGGVQITDEISEYGWFFQNEMPEGMIPAEAVKFQDSFGFKRTPFVR